MVLGLASVPDLLRLVFLPAFAWAAYRDVRTRRLPNALWPPLALVGVVALALEAAATYPFAGYEGRVFLVRVGFALLFLLPFAYGAYFLRAFGGADAKATMVLALGLPTTPAYALPAGVVAALPPTVLAALPRTTLPLVPSLLGVTAMATLTNAVLVALLYVGYLAVGNLVRGRVGLAMFVGRPTPVERLADRHGSLLRTDGSLPRSGLDLDALRMYFRWRGCTLADLRADPAAFREPDFVGDTFDPTDGATHRGPDTGGPAGSGAATSGAGSDAATDGREADDWAGTGFVQAETEETADAGDAETSGTEAGTVTEAGTAANASEAETTDTDATGTGATTDTDATATDTDEATDDALHDPWAAAAFLDAVDGSAYGTTPETLRSGLQTVAETDRVWVSPGLPFVVPLFGGLLVALTLGDVLTLLLRAVGLA
ncbi:prepilin peptidase [Halobaculum sp. MBLA0147]|uniref:prepilin peptidase n=1 Tax=Halobaculum sp. MBLA0147 TaxID=3079934 RepID=UPI003523CBF3